MCVYVCNVRSETSVLATDVKCDMTRWICKFYAVRVRVVMMMLLMMLL